MELNINELKKLCIKNINKECKTYFYDEGNEEQKKEQGSILALFLRQGLNNGFNGFGMKNVRRIGKLIYGNLHGLINNNYIEKNGFNNCGIKLG